MADFRHRTVCRPASERHLDVHLALPERVYVPPRRLGDDDPVRFDFLRRESAPDGIGLLVHDGVHDEAAVERQAGALQRDGRRAHRGDTAEHVARAAPIDAPIADVATERVDRPTFPHGHRVQVPVEYERRTFCGTNLGDDIRSARSNLTQTRRDAVVFEIGDEGARNRFLVARRVLARDAYEGAKEVQSLRFGDRREHARAET